MECNVYAHHSIKKKGVFLLLGLRIGLVAYIGFSEDMTDGLFG